MSDELLEFLGIAAGGIAIYLVAQNNAPAIKKAVSSIPAVSNIIPVSTRAPQDDRAPAPRGTCPPGYSPDYTMGVMHCHDPHGTRELNPNVKMFNPQWQNAWGDDGWASPPLIPTPSQTLAPPKPEPQTLREPSRIISSVNPQIKKSEEKEKKVHTQVECPKDLNTMKCGSNCYKNGKLYKIVCSEAEREALYPPKKTKKKSITVPANFPSDVTISPGETPYPEVGDTPGGADVPIPPLQLAPGQQPIKPTIPPGAPGQAPTPSAPAPQLQPIQTGPSGPGRLVGRSLPSTGDYHGQKIDTNGCYNGNVSCPPCKRYTCRAGIGTNPDKKPAYEAGYQKIPVSDLLGGSKNFHLIYHFTLGKGSEKGAGSTTEVTAGYDGSNSKATATGITIGIRNGNGAVMARTEDHNDSHKVPGEYRELCKEGTGDCGGVSRIPEFAEKKDGTGGAYGKSFDIIWVGSQIPGGVNYKGYVRVGNNTYLIVNLNNPTTGGKSGAGSHAIGGGTKINYLTQHNYFARGRTDAAGSSKIVGELWADDNNIYAPSNVITRDRGYHYQSELGYMTSGYLV